MSANLGTPRGRAFAEALPALALVGLVLLATWKLTLGGRIIARGDLLLYFYPLRDYAAQALREGRMPLWNPHTFMGAPFLANPQVGFFYPFNVLTAWLPTEVAVSWQIALHLLIAALGGYALARLGFALSPAAGFACGLTFGLGGYLGAQVEHLNQLQALAWLPWAALALVRPARLASRAAALAGLLALQLLAGHAQSVYISLIGLGILVVVRAIALLAARRRREAAALSIALALGGGVAALLAAVQLVPTLELSRESARAGGLPFNEVASFSWRPWVVGRALLPTYGDPLFPEYVAYLGGAGLALALLGATQPPLGQRSTWALGLALVIVGAVLALGMATPLFGVPYRFLPGFNLFRAQARWLVLAALGASVLVALAVERLQRGGLSARRWALGWGALVVALVAAIGLGIRLSPEPEYAALPERRVLIGWAGSLLAGNMVVGVTLTPLSPPKGRGGWGVRAVLLLLALELSVAAQFQPFARAADRQALTSLRPSTAFLLAHAGGGRVLALSSLFFDPGDKAEQELIYGAQLSPNETYDRLIASKHKEILSPNLALYYRLNSVDGYDGGVLPTRRYADFVRRFADLPAGSVDGRLREFLRGVPDDRWLDAMAVRYLIADKTQDAFFDGVYYDLLFVQPITQPHTFALDLFDATGLGVVLSAPGSATGAPIARAEVRFADGSTQTFTVRAQPSALPYFAVRLEWGERRLAEQLTLAPLSQLLAVHGLTSIDATDGSFLSHPVRAGLRLAHSGDVKVYERPHIASRAELRLDNGAALPVRVEDLSPEHVRLHLPAREPPATLILRDACFPGWTASADGIPLEIACEDGLFRAVRVQLGVRQVEMHYRPTSLGLSLALSGVGVFVWGVLLASGARAHRQARLSARFSLHVAQLGVRFDEQRRRP